MTPNDVSILISCRNEESNVERCIREVARVLPSAEILIIDGGTDRTFAIAESLRSQFPNLRPLRNAGDRGKMNPIFTGATLTMDGLIIHTNNRVYNTAGAASGSKWGSGGNVDGTRSLLLGQQAMLYADIWGAADWHEETLDSGAKNAITLSQNPLIIEALPHNDPRLASGVVERIGAAMLAAGEPVASG